MQNTKTKMITVLLLAVLTLAAFPLAVHASTGFITINNVTPSIPGISVQAGANVSLFFGNVTFSGGQFVLYIGPQGFSQITTTAPNIDIQYTPTLNLLDLQALALTQVAGNAQYPGAWTLGFGWINGTIKQDLAGGNFFIKAFDGTSTSVAVTDTYITVIANVFVVPTSGAAGQSITLSGYAFPANALVNLTYSSVSLGANKPIATLVPTGILGNFSYPIAAPDTLLQLAAGATAVTNENITFTVVENRTGATYSAVFMEFARGLAQVRDAKTGGSQQLPGAGNLFGNNTLFTTGSANALAGIGVNTVVRIAGNYFFPGSLVAKFDNAVVTNTAPTINGTGWFNTTLTVPPTTNGLHNITITDGNNTVFTLFVTIVPSLTLSPTRGIVGTTVTATGYGFTAPSGTTVNNASIAWPGVTRYRGSAFVDATGSFVITFTVPTTVGGVNNVTALENATGSFVVIASATFTVDASFSVTPGSFVNNYSALVVASGGGFKVGSVYMPNIDNQLFGFNPLGSTFQTGISPDANGAISITFVGAGFSVGTHVFSLYENQTTTPAAYAGFNVTGDPLSSTAMLEAINATVSQINGTLNLIGANVTSIKGSVATIQTTTGSIQANLTSIGAQITSISGTMVTLQTTIGTLTTSVNSLSGQIGGISSIQSGVAQIQTTLGTVTSSLSNINAALTGLTGTTATITTTLGDVTTSLASIDTKVTTIENGVATIQTDLGTVKGTVTSISGSVATIQTALGTIQADVSGLKTDLATVQTDVASNKTTSESLSPLIIVAIVLALIAAIAAIASIVLMRRKIAG